MAEPKPNPVYDDDTSEKPVTRPDLRARENISGNNTGATSGGGATGTGSQTGGASSSTGTSSGGTDSSTPSRGGGLYNSTGDTPAKIKNAEEAAAKSDDDDRVGKGYTGSNSSSRGRFRFRMTRRKAVVGIGTTTLITGVFGFFSISSGPLEFIHIAQLMDRFHFSSQQDAEDGRLMKIARYIKEPDKPQNTRLGIVGRSVAGKLDTKIKDATGLGSDFDERSGRFKGYVGERSHEQFKGKPREEIKTQLAARYNIDPSAITVTDTQVHVNPDPGGVNAPRRYLAQTRFARALLGQAGYSKKSQYVGSRVLGKRAGWTFHPIKKLDAEIQARAIEKGKDGIKKLKEQFASQEVTNIDGDVTKPGGNPESQTEKDSEGKTVPKPGSNETKQGVDDVKDVTKDEDRAKPKTVEDASAGLKTKIGGSAASLVGVVCVLNSINHAVKTERQAKVVVPMMKMAGEAMSLGSQAQSGQDISALQLGFYKDQLDAKGKDGNVTSTWNQAESIQAELGGPQNPQYDIPKEGQVFTGSAPFDFLNNPAIDSVCGILGSTLGTIFSIATGPISALVSSAAMGPATDYMANWLSGAPIDALAAGAARGNYINYGARGSANQQYAAAGGVELNTANEDTLKNTTAVLDKQEFQSKSIAYRIFNPKDSQTLASHIIDNYGSETPVQDVASMAHNFSSIFVSVLKAPATLLSGVTHAASANPTYDYHGMKMVGFTAKELGDTDFDNPFDSACRVVGDCKLSGGRKLSAAQGILGGSSGDGYVKRAEKCFGVKITNNPSSGWTIDSSSSDVNFLDADKYPSSECSSDSNEDWVRVRFWILDTATIEGYDCYQSDTDTSDQSCDDVGFGNPSGSTGTTPTSGNLNAQAAQKAAQDASTGGVKVGFALYDASGKQLGKYNESTQNYGASITKSMLLVAYLKQVGSSSLSSEAKSELTAMIENSDNDAANWVYSHLHNGSAAVNAVASEAGMSNFSIDTSDTIYTLGQSKITADDFAKFFAKIDTYMPASQKIFGKNLLANLSSADQNGLLRAGLPGTVYSKEGWKPESSGLLGAPYVVNQAAQFSSGGTTYGIAVTVGGTSNQSSGEAIVQKIAAALVGSN